MTNLNAEGEKARDFIMILPDRLDKIAQRIVIPKESPKLKWINAI